MSWWLSWLLWPLVREGRAPRTDFVARTTYGSHAGAYLNQEAARSMWPDTQPSAGPDPEQDKR